MKSPHEIKKSKRREIFFFFQALCIVSKAIYFKRHNENLFSILCQSHFHSFLIQMCEIIHIMLDLPAMDGF